MFNEIQSIAKVKGASMEIAKLIVQKPSVVMNGKGTPAELSTSTEEKDVEIFGMNNIKFHYPSKEDVPVLKGVTINVKKNQIVALVG